MKTIFLSLAALSLSMTAWSQPQSITLELPTMNCAMCPITVKKSLEKVEGVTQVTVNYDEKIATVTFDDDKTQATALTRATTDAGYPSTIKPL